jgi:hypothetical protein
MTDREFNQADPELEKRVIFGAKFDRQFREAVRKFWAKRGMREPDCGDAYYSEKHARRRSKTAQDASERGNV